MFDDIRSNDERGLDESKRARGTNGEHPLTDREVPIEGPAASLLPAAVHAWLDGEISEADARRGADARVVDFWVRLEAAAIERRRMRAPSDLAARVMEELSRPV